MSFSSVSGTGTVVPERKSRYRIVVLPGDGVGPEVCSGAMEVLHAVADLHGFTVETDEHHAGEAAIAHYGTPLPEEVRDAALSADAVFLGAVGGATPPPPGEPRPEDSVLGLRRELDAFANLRPARWRQTLAHASSLKPEVVDGVDVLLVRETTAGAFFAEPRGVDSVRGVRHAVDTWFYDEPTIRRVVEKACDLALLRDSKVTSIDKANVLTTGGLWRTVASEVASTRPDVAFDHMFVDNAAAQLLIAPRQFDVIVTENLFGDILSDLFAGLVGSLGMLPSATLGSRVGLFEPVHGSAPDIAGQGIANPCAAIGSVALMLRHGLGEELAADAVERAIELALAQGARTRDIAGEGEQVLGTTAMTDRVLACLADLRATAE